jgi:hypothetical protein
MCLQHPFHQGRGAQRGFLREKIFFPIAWIPAPINILMLTGNC